MGKKLFREGGPHQIKQVGDTVHMKVAIPSDEDGRVARKCPNPECSPGYFKVKPETGIAGQQDIIYCPYCHHEDAPNNFYSDEQARYATDLMLEEAKIGVQKMLADALGLGYSGRRTFGGGMISMELSLTSEPSAPVQAPCEEELWREVVCPNCGLDQAVFGLASWCSDCGRDIFLAGVAGELSTVRGMFGDVERRKQLLGRRAAAKDFENCLEDAVSVFEASVRAIVGRALRGRGLSREDVEKTFKKIGNAFQSVARTREQLDKLLGVQLPDDPVWQRMGQLFEKRHPIAHSLGVVDATYRTRTAQAEIEGRELRITSADIEAILGDVEHIVARIHAAALPASSP